MPRNGLASSVPPRELNLDAEGDVGCAKESMEAMWLMQQDVAQNHVAATHQTRECIQVAFDEAASR